MDGERPSRARLIVRPLALFLAVSAGVFGLAKVHLAKPGVPKIALGTQVALGDSYRGDTIFIQKCGSCHGIGGEGGSVGPRLVGDRIGLARVKAQIDQGGGAMPAALVSGQAERDVLAFVATLVKAPGGGAASAAAGATLFGQRCSSCHGPGGAGGGIGPKLAGAGFSEATVRTTIASGPGAMPAKLVTGSALGSVLAYLRTIGAIK